MSSSDKVNQKMSNTGVMEILRSYAFSGNAGNHECLDETRCSRLIDGQLSDQEREAVMGHLADCRNCLDLVTGLVLLERDDVATLPPDLLAAALALNPEQQPIQTSALYHWQTKLAVAASLVLVVGALVWQYEGILELRPTNDSTEPTIEARLDVRIGAHDEERLTIISPTGNSNINPENIELQWSPVDGSVFYEIQLLSDDGDVMWEGRTENTNVQLPQDLQFDGAGGYFLWVKAHLSDGKSIKSKAVFIRIKGDGQE